MINVKITTPFPDWPLIRQTPNKSGKWKNIQFYVNDDSIDKCDFFVVYDGLNKENILRCNSKNTLFITGEPETVKKYNSSFLNQFSYVITSQKNIKHKGLILSQQSLMWMVGGNYSNGKWKSEFTKDYDELKKINTYTKNKLISVILSNKDITLGHKQKNLFVKKLKEHFGEKLDVFGVGHNEIEDKWTAISNYKYHLVLENCSINHYWTEKLADCYLAGAFPFYYGCKNLNTYFSPESYIKININKVDESIEIIKEAISKNTFENSQEHISHAKQLVLDKYNIFPMLTEFINCNLYVSSNNELLSIKPENNFSKNIIFKFLNLFKKKHS